MADNKQYVQQVQNNDNVMISEDVIAAIVANAVTEVKGVVGLTAKPGVDIVELIGKKGWTKGIKVYVSPENEVSIDCNVTVSYGESVVSVAKDVQAAIHTSLEDLTGVVIASVNVNICGIVRQ